MSSFVVAALYKFVTLNNYQDLQEPIQNECKKYGIKGTLLLAEEGINGTIAGTREGIDGILNYLRSDIRLSNLEHKESLATDMPFFRMKVRLKKEIVTLGVEGIDPNKNVGTYVDPKDWNALIQDPDVVVLDTRNEYEYEIGTFKNALNPHTDTFREFPAYVKKNFTPEKTQKVAMFCTGGIRCEKASSYMLEQGFKEVYHLKGGILKYLETIPEQESLWEGECFVFDGRTAVKHGMEEGDHETCFGCRWPISIQDKTSPKYKEGVHCPHCYDSMSEEHLKRVAARHQQILHAKKHGRQHLGS